VNIVDAYTMDYPCLYKQYCIRGLQQLSYKNGKCTMVGVDPDENPQLRSVSGDGCGSTAARPGCISSLHGLLCN